jgi:hypothetical protein
VVASLGGAHFVGMVDRDLAGKLPSEGTMTGIARDPTCSDIVRRWHLADLPQCPLPLPLLGRMCCKTIFTTEMSNIDSRMDTSAQYRSKTLLNQIRILPARHSASSFATRSGSKRTSMFATSIFRI